MLPGGMAFESTLLSAICARVRLYPLGVSSITPFGALPMPSHTGCAAWHMLQREITISSACGEGHGAGGALDRDGGKGRQPDDGDAANGRHPHVHQGDGRPLCRLL